MPDLPDEGLASLASSSGAPSQRAVTFSPEAVIFRMLHSLAIFATPDASCLCRPLR